MPPSPASEPRVRASGARSHWARSAPRLHATSSQEETPLLRSLVHPPSRELATRRRGGVAGASSDSDADTPRGEPGPFNVLDDEGCVASFRPLVQADRATVARVFAQLSAESRFRRFNSLYANLSDRQLTSLFDLDYRDRFAWAVELSCDGETAPAAVGRYARYVGTRRADVALTIDDAWHNRGLGGTLLDTLIITAHHHGFVAFDTIVTADNRAMLHLLQERGAQVSGPSAGVVDVVLPLAGRIGQLSAHPLARMLVPSA
jgi:GNAT superfamily N-acetyltransferase